MPLSDGELRQEVARHDWTNNISLSEAVSTLPGTPQFDSDWRVQSILRKLDILFGERLDGLRVADLGCLEGTFALALARRGANVLGVEGRAENLEKCRLLQQHFQLPNLDFILADVKDFTVKSFGHFDVVLVLGILYHLDNPVRWLKQLSETTEVIIVDSGYAPLDDASLAKLKGLDANLSDLITTVIDGTRYDGRWFVEHMGNLRAACSNRRSFWLTRDSLILALCRAGFELVIEQRDHRWPRDACRTQFVAARPPNAARPGDGRQVPSWAEIENACERLMCDWRNDGARRTAPTLVDRAASAIAPHPALARLARNLRRGAGQLVPPAGSASRNRPAQKSR